MSAWSTSVTGEYAALAKTASLPGAAPISFRYGVNIELPPDTPSSAAYAPPALLPIAMMCPVSPGTCRRL